MTKAEYIKKYGNAAKIFFHLTSKGLSRAGACGVLGNIQAESSFNPGIEEYATGIGYGICQWSFGRRTNLENYAKKKKKKKSDLTLQCDFLLLELTTSYKSLYSSLCSTTISVEKAADKFVRDFERPANVSYTSKWRQKYAEAWLEKLKKAPISNDTTTGDSGSILEVHPEKLYSSNNYKYFDYSTKVDSTSSLYIFANSLANSIKSLSTKTISTKTNNTTGALNDNKLASLFNSYTSYTQSKNKTKISGTIYGSPLPTAPSLVESPFIELTIGNITFGTYHKNKYPNYISSLNVKKTNGSVNEYTVNLIHQIFPGDNPNYIDNILSSVRYNEITISYGDGVSSTIFRDAKAMITNVTTSFDFVGCNIKYTINATSFAILAATSKYSFPSTMDKPSNVIRNMLYGSDNSNLLFYFSGMTNKTSVESRGLIPSDDKKVYISEAKDMNSFNYLTKLVSLMENNTNSNSLYNNSLYCLSVEDDSNGAYFKINEITTNPTALNSTFMHEVTIGYPDSNMVFNFSIDTDFAWASAYGSTSDIYKYNYNIDSSGNKYFTKTSPLLKTNSANDNTNTISSNILTQLTSYPLSATLTVKGLLQPIMLLQYIKINCVYYGNVRDTSGVYIVTQQEDQLSSSGYRTKLSLTRVAGTDEYINRDARVSTN